MGTGDTPVYIWNLWVFRHEIVDNHHLPFLTSSILALSQPLPLVLHNYTTFANLLAFPLLPVIGLVRTFNLLLIAGQTMTAYAMYRYARMRTGDSAAAWLGGLIFGFSPYMTARSAEHFSLILAAPLPLFAWLLYRIHKQGPSFGLSCGAGATVAWAFLCDPYYAVYCLMLAMFFVGHSAVTVERRSLGARGDWWRAGLDLTILCVAGLIAGLVIRGGGRLNVFGIHISVMRLYTPMLVLTVLVLLRWWSRTRPRLVNSWPLSAYMHVLVPAGVMCVLILTPVLYAAGSPFGDANGSGRKFSGRTVPLVSTCWGFSRRTPPTPGSGDCRRAGWRRCPTASSRTSLRFHWQRS